MQIELTRKGRLAAIRVRAIQQMKDRAIPVEEAQGRYLAAGGKVCDFRLYVAAFMLRQTPDSN
jgi:hypothetical protein